MKRYVSITVVVLFALLAVLRQFAGGPRVQAQSAALIEPTTQPAGRPTIQPALAMPASGDSASSAKVAATQTGSLDCAGCHGPGKTLPYLGGGHFHADAHKAYDHGFHARAIQNQERRKLS